MSAPFQVAGSPPAPLEITDRASGVLAGAEIAAQRAIYMRMETYPLPTWSQVAAACGFSNAQAAQYAVAKALRNNRAAAKLAVEDYRELQLENIERALEICWRIVNKFHVKVSHGQVIRLLDSRTGETHLLEDAAPVLAAVDRILKLEQFRSELIGTRVQNSVDPEEQVIRVVIDSVDTRELT